MCKSLILPLLFFLSGHLPAQSPADPLKYTALNIPDSMKKGAHAVYRLRETMIDIQSPSRYTMYDHEIVTFLNKDAAPLLRQRFWFDKFSKVEEIDIRVFNALGAEIKRYRKKDFETAAYDDNMSLHSDNMIMRLDIPAPDYPFTLEITSQQKMTGYIAFPRQIVNSTNQSMEQYRLTVRVPSEMDIRYSSLNIDLKPVSTVQGNSKTYFWEAKQLVAEEREDGSYMARYHFPQIHLAPNTFEYDGYRGSSTTWKSFGEWAYPLYNDQAPFSPSRTEELKRMVAHCKTDREKIEVLYNHLKKTMRYVSIQLGIGGFKPFPVSFVDEKKYGDCKALSNYMRYMLKTVGIKAYPALINRGYDAMPVSPDFPANGFNHAVVLVPMEKDSLWLECTSNNNACGDLGSDNENRYALLLTEEGGKLVPTPRSSSDRNKLITKTNIILNKEGAAEVRSAIYCTGGFWSQYYELMQYEREQQKKIMVNHLGYKSPESFEMVNAGDSATGNRFVLSLSYDQAFDFKAGNKYFFRPRINRICDEELGRSDRKWEYLFNFPYDKTDSTFYRLPEGFTPDRLPPVKEVRSKYGYYRNEVVNNPAGNGFMVIARLVLNNHIIPANEYKDMAVFFAEVNKHESEKIIVRGD